MKKAAIFVEGHTELIFVREFLLKYYEAVVEIECRTLFSDGAFHSAEFDFSNPNASVHFQIINVGNDNAVMSRMLRREEFLWSQGYEAIICLRDMYSSAYREVTNKVDPDVIHSFIEGARQSLTSAKKPESIDFVFAIMEVEAWFLGSISLFVHLDSRLTADFICVSLGHDFNALDPETTIYHPAKFVDDIYQLVGMQYDKHKKDIEAIASRYSREDFISLYESAKCSTFNQFVDCIQRRMA